MTDYWIENLKQKLPDFLNKMYVDNYIKYSLSGDIYTSSVNWGLGNYVFFTKIIGISDLINNYSENELEFLKNKILSFSNTTGVISDPIVTDWGKKDKLKNIFNLNNEKKTKVFDLRRAETRQSYAALNILNKKPLYIYKNIPYNSNSLHKFLNSFNWSKPWHAGSHVSHLLFFLKQNSNFFNYKNSKSKNLIAETIKFINNIQSKNDGCWYIGNNVSLTEKINGAMKILTGLHAAEIFEFNNPEKLIDTALTAINNGQACDNFNVVYVLYSASLLTDYRKNDIKIFLENRLNIYKEYYHEDIGGFSFYKNKTNEYYYGKRITKGLNEPDIHGTAMFIWGLAFIDKIIDLGLNFKIPLN